MFDQCTRCINWNGRLLVIGFASGIIPKFPINLALVKGFSLVGVFWGRFVNTSPDQHSEDMLQLFSWYEEGKIKPHIEQVFPLNEVTLVLNKFIERSIVGKLVITN